MDRYHKVEKPKPQTPIKDNEIRITSQGPIRNYINYASSLLLQPSNRGVAVFTAMGQAINKTVAIAEILKKRNPHLHQDTAISSVSITDVWEPIEEGLMPVEMTRHVSMISITLSTTQLNTKSPGYQAPQRVEPPTNRYQQRPPMQTGYNVGDEDSYGRGRALGRGRGRGYGYGRGGYGNYGHYQDNDDRHPKGRSYGYDSKAGYGNYGNYQDNDDGYQNERGYSYGSRGGYRNYGNYQGYYNRGRRAWSGRGGGYHDPGFERGRGRWGGYRGGRSRGGGGY